MANTFFKIQTVTVGSGGAATIEFSAIPATYTDLKVLISARSTHADIDDHLFVKPNNSALNMTQQWMRGNGSISNTGTNTNFAVPAANSSASVFSNTEFYFPNYNSALNKDFQGTTVGENNATEAYMYYSSFLWSDTSAITSLVLDLVNGNFAQYSTATLYGIKSS